MTDNDPFPDIRDAEPENAEAIFELQRLAFRRQALLYDDPALPPLVQTLEELRTDFRTHTFLKAVTGDRIVGSVRGRVEGDVCFVSRLIVHPEVQNRGVGKALMRAIEERFDSVVRYELYTGHKSVKNLALYEGLGYVRFREEPQSDKVMLIHMRKERTTGR